MITVNDLSEIPAFLGRSPVGLPFTGLLAQEEEYTVPFYFLRVTQDPVLFVHFNGAVDRNIRPNGVVFQRQSWAHDMRGSLLYLSDPSILNVEGMSLGWGQTPLDMNFFPSFAAEVAKTFSVWLEIDNRVYAGSSAGGYQAAAAAVFDENARAWVNNAQFDWTRYESVTSVNRVVNMLGFSTVEELKRSAALRTSIPALIEREQSAPRISYQLNVESSTDVVRQLPVFQELDGKVELCEYHDSASGHNPLLRHEWCRALVEFGLSDRLR